MKIRVFFSGILLFISFLQLHAQTLPVGLLSNIEDIVRRRQLLGNDTSNRSFLIRPLFMSETDELGFGERELNYSLRTELFSSNNNAVKLYALPVVLKQQFNSHHPYGINDGAMIPSKGYQAMFSAGLYFKAGPLSIQLRPEYVFAQNSDYPELTDYDQPASLLTQYNNYLNRVELPHRFGESTYSKLNLGQSSLRLTFGAISAGISNENIWWGPGKANSLILTNNSPGFLHFTINTVKPIKTGIGSFEAQLIGGKIENAGYPTTFNGTVKNKPDMWRYVNGLTMTYQPKWLPGLFLGAERMFMLYEADLNGVGDYLPVFSFFTKSAYAEDSNSNTEDAKNRNQLLSLSARWVMPESNSEVYFQYGREDHSWNLRDALLEPEHSRAYIAGFRKLVALAKDDHFLDLGLEVTQMQSSGLTQVRSFSNWYSHTQILQGYTNRGEFLGAGIGPDNMQSLDIDWVNGLKRIGLRIERRVHNNQLYIRAFAVTQDPRRHWVDIGVIGKVDWNFKKLIFNSELGLIRNLNYQWYLAEPATNEFWYGPKNDITNFHFKIGLMYSL